MNKILTLLILIFASLGAHAAEKQEACIKFQKEFGWSKGYSVIATVISGSDLNSAVGSFSKYNSFSTYAVVFWDENQASIFELPSLSMGSLPIFEQEVEDQEGRMWMIKAGHDFCY
jgi:hypothetical protein